MQAQSIKGKSTEEIQTALNQQLANGFSPTLAVVFVSIRQNIEAVCQVFRSVGIDCIGATSCNEFTDGYQSEGGITALLLELDKSHYALLYEDLDNRSLSETALQLAQQVQQKFTNPAVILLATSLLEDGSILDGETLSRILDECLGSTTNLFGGLAGDDLTFQGTVVFVNGRLGHQALATLVFNEDAIKMDGVALSGWKSIGISKTITKSRHHFIYEIDGEPALKTYLRFLGEDYDTIDDKTDFFDGLALHYPFQIERNGREPMMCTPMGYDKAEGALVMESNVEEGANFRFSTLPDFNIVETVIDKAKEIKERHNADADAVLIFSCAGRLAALGPMAKQENDGIADVWQAPMAGFFTYGEFGRALNDKHEFHSTTCSWVALKEK